MIPIYTLWAGINRERTQRQFMDWKKTIFKPAPTTEPAAPPSPLANRLRSLTMNQRIYIFWFGISHTVKVVFLASGLLVYLLASVIQRVDEVEAVYVDTAKTCGASRWQRIWSVFAPLALGRLSDDSRALVPITWTYIVIAEGFNLGEGGLGALVSIYTRPHRWDVVFALVVVIAAIGFAQDKLWLAVDRRIFKWKYA